MSVEEVVVAQLGGHRFLTGDGGSLACNSVGAGLHLVGSVHAVLLRRHNGSEDTRMRPTTDAVGLAPIRWTPRFELDPASSARIGCGVAKRVAPQRTPI